MGDLGQASEVVQGMPSQPDHTVTCLLLWSHQQHRVHLPMDSFLMGGIFGVCVSVPFPQY